MNTTRRNFLAASATSVALAAAHREETWPKTDLGVLLYSYGIHARATKGFADPLVFIEFCRKRGIAGVQVPLGRRNADDSAKIKKRAEDAGMYLEGVIRPPADKDDLPRFTEEIQTAVACGANVVRTVMLGGRRYEQFKKAEDFTTFVKKAQRSLELAEPIVRRHRVKLAVENHKDYRVDEQLAALNKIGSEHIGICVDTGNNIALLEEPLSVVKQLAPLVFTVHLKDMGVSEYSDGFLLSEVPLGKGVLELPAIIKTLRKANPKVRLNLEMITRDPLRIPCLTDAYWATLDKVPGRDLARMLAYIRKYQKKEPLTRISELSRDKQLASEDAHVRESLTFFRNERFRQDAGLAK